jgi:2-haloacid dehalogenase
MKIDWNKGGEKMDHIQAIVFDAYGTLFDVHSVVDACNRLFPEKGNQISEVWRAKQLEYTWLRSMMGRYQDFHRVTEDALRYACHSLGLPITDAQEKELMEEYLHLNCFKEVHDVLKQMQNHQLAIFSNGTLDMLKPLVQNTGLDSYIHDVFSVDEAKVYKPAPRAYTLILDELKLEREEILFVSSNSWDIVGAKSFGFHVAWVNRGNKTFEELGKNPDLILSDLGGLIASYWALRQKDEVCH